MKELLGTSYYFLKQYFGKDVPTTGYDEFIPQYLKEKQNLAREETGAILKDNVVEEIVGVQAVGSTVLENKKGEEIAQLTFTELPTLYSSMTTSSVGLEIGTGRIVEDKVTKTAVASKSRPMIEALGPFAQLIQPEQEGEEQEGDEQDEYEQEAYEGSIEEEKEEEEDIRPPVDQTQTTAAILIEKNEEIKQEIEKDAKEAAQEKALQQEEQQYKLDQIKQWVTQSTINQKQAENKLKEATDLYNKSKTLGLFGGDEKLKQNMEEKQKEKEKADQEYKIWYARYLEATKEDRERKQKEKEEAEKQKRMDAVDELIKQQEQQELEKNAAAKIKAYIAKLKEAAQKEKDKKEAAEKQKRYEAVEAQLEEIERKEKEAISEREKAALEAETKTLLQNVEDALDPNDIVFEEDKTQVVSEAAKEAVKTISFLGLNSAEAILEAQRQLAEKKQLTEQEEARKKAIQSLFASVSSGVGKNREQIEQETKESLTETKNRLQSENDKITKLDTSNLDSLSKITPLRQQNKAIRDSIESLYTKLEANTDNYVKVLVNDQTEIKNQEIETLTDEVNNLYDYIKSKSENLEITLKLQEDELKKKEAEEQKRKDEQAELARISEQQKAEQIANVEKEINEKLGEIITKKGVIKETFHSINEIQQKIIDNPDEDISSLNKQIAALETALPELEALGATVQSVLKQNNLSQDKAIKTKYPQIGDIEEVIEKGKETLEFAKKSVLDQQEKQQKKLEKIQETKNGMVALKQRIEDLTIYINENMGKLQPKETTLEDAKKIMDIIKEKYTIAERRYNNLQTRIKNGITDKEIVDKNEEIQELFRVMENRFQVAQGLYDELPTSPTIKQVEVKKYSDIEDNNTLNRVTVTRPNISITRSTPTKQVAEYEEATEKLENDLTLKQRRSQTILDKRKQQQPTQPTLDVRDVLNRLEDFLEIQKRRKENIRNTGLTISNERPMEAKNILEGIKDKYETTQSEYDKLQGPLTYISDKRITDKRKEIEKSIKEMEELVKTAEDRIKKGNTQSRGDLKPKGGPVEPLVIEDLEEIGSAPIVSGKSPNVYDTSSDEYYNKLDRMLEPQFKKTAEDNEATYQASIKQKARQKGRVSNRQNEAEQLLLNQSKRRALYGGGKKTTKRRMKKNKTKKRHT